MKKSNDKTVSTEGRRWWMLWRWSPKPYQGRRDRLSAEAQGDASSYWLRGGR